MEPDPPPAPGPILRCEKCGNQHQSICASDITEFTWPHPAREVFIMGEWSKWQSKEQLHRINNSFVLHKNLKVGTYRYKFVVDGKWQHDWEQPHESDSYGGYNNVFPRTVYPPIAEVDQDMPSDQKVVKVTTHLIGNDVRILGSWDNWRNELKMERKHNPLRNCDESFTNLILKNGMSYEFKFKVNGDYVIDETMPTIRNMYGTFNNHMIVKEVNHIESPNASRSIGRNSQGAKEIEPKVWKWTRVSLEEFRDCIFGHSISNVGDDLFIFGGKRRGAFTSDLIRTKASDLAHVEIERIAITPRAFHSTLAYGNKLIIYGGCSQADILSDYHVFVTQTNQWIQSTQIKGTPAHKREKGSCVLFKKLLVFFGGYYCSPDIELETFFNDIEVLDIENMEWTKTSRIEGPEPPARFSHTASMFGEYMVVFGGEENHNKNLNDVWQINLDRTGDTLKWEMLKPSGKPPTPRHGHSSDIIQHYMIIFGGLGDDNVALNDVKILDLKLLQWYLPFGLRIHPVVNGDIPKPRHYHATITVNHQQIIMFGGKTSSHRNENIYILRPSEVAEILNFDNESEV